MQQERNPTTVGQLLTQIQDLQNKVNSLADATEFYDTKTASRSGASHVPSQPLIFPSPRGMLSRDSGLPHDARNTMGTSGNVFDSPPAREGPSSALLENSRNLASSSCGLGPGNTGNRMEHGRGVRQEPQSSSIPTPRFNQGIANGTHKVILEKTYLHLGKFADSLEFKSWKINFKTEVCSKSAVPQLTMHWIKEVEIAESMDNQSYDIAIDHRRKRCPRLRYA